MLNFLSCWSSFPGHQACGSTALPCWPSRRGSYSYTTPPCWPSLTGHPAGDITDQGRLGGDYKGCNNFPDVTFVFKDNKMKRSDKCGLEPFDKITDFVKNIAMDKLEISPKQIYLEKYWKTKLIFMTI